jgi:type II secretory pathway pseudopilin PulG
MIKAKIKKWFTLVELIVVITILTIIWAISFISFQWYTKDARDAARIESLKTIQKWLDSFYIWKNSFPMPDKYVSIYSSGELIWYQWYVWSTVWSLINGQNLLDPLDKTYFTYYIDTTFKKYQLLWLWEKKEIPSYLSFINTTYAWDNTNRYPISIWSQLGIILDSNKNPIQETWTWIDIATATWTYIWVKSSNNIITWTWLVLKDLNPNYIVRTLWGSWSDLPLEMSLDNYWNSYSIWRYWNDNLNTNKVIDFAWNTLLWKGNIVSQNSYVSKMDSIWNQKWIKNAGWNGNLFVSKIIWDNNYNSYVIWIYINDNVNTNKIVDFAWNTLSWVSSIVSNDFFVAKLDQDWNQKWIKTLWWSWSENIIYIDIDKSNNLYIWGVYFNSNTNANSAKDFSWNTFLWKTSDFAWWDLFLAKLDSDGNQKWIKSMWWSATIWYETAAQLRVDSSWDIYFGGTFANDSTNSTLATWFWWEPLIPTTTNNSWQWFILKLDSNWNKIFMTYFWWIWWAWINSINLDNQWNIYYFWTYYSNTSDSYQIRDFNWNVLLWKSSTDSYDIIIAKINSIWQQEWVRTLWWMSDDSATSVYIWNWNIYVWWTFQNDLSNSRSAKDFAWNTINWVSNTAWRDLFIAMLDSSWNQKWIKTLWSTWNDNFNQVIWNNDWNVYILWSHLTYTEAKDFNWTSILSNWLPDSQEWFLAKLDINWIQRKFFTLIWKWVDLLSYSIFNKDWDLLILWRYHNDLSNTNLSKDLKWYTLLWRSNNNALTWAQDAIFQILFKKDLE